MQEDVFLQVSFGGKNWLGISQLAAKDAGELFFGLLALVQQGGRGEGEWFQKLAKVKFLAAETGFRRENAVAHFAGEPSVLCRRYLYGRQRSFGACHNLLLSGVWEKVVVHWL